MFLNSVCCLISAGIALWAFPTCRRQGGWCLIFPAGCGVWAACVVACLGLHPWWMLPLTAFCCLFVLLLAYFLFAEPK